MAALVADGICRYAVEGVFSGRPVINIVDMKIDTTGTVGDRGEACFAQAGRLLNAWHDCFIEWFLVNNYTALQVSYIDLNSLTGSTGERSSTDEHDWPAQGAGTTNAMPANVAMRINKRTSAGRGSKQGRMYLCGVNEGMTTDENPNQLNAETISGCNDKLVDFLEDVRREDPVGEVGLYTSQMHVVHTVAGEFTNSTEIISLQVDGTLATQRRRLR